MSSLTLSEYQIRAGYTAIYPEKNSIIGLMYTTIGLSGEVGEFANNVKKLWRDGKKSDDLGKELSDCLWYLAQSATELGLDLGDLAQANLDKLASRKDRGVLQGSGDNR